MSLSFWILHEIIDNPQRTNYVFQLLIKVPWNENTAKFLDIFRIGSTF